MLSTERAQKVFVVWFILLTLIALYNFGHNMFDGAAQEDIIKRYQQNEARYEKSIAEHDEFKKHHAYVLGHIESIERILAGNKVEKSATNK